MTQEIKFIKEEIFHLEEGQYVEFKKIDSQKPVNKILNHADEYVTGFLNASVEGDIYIGIDDSGKISGVTLKRNEKDEILRSIPNKLRDTKPPVIQSCYKIYFHNIYDIEQNEIESLYIVHIHIYKVEFQEEYLYKTVGGSTYLKKESNCLKLNDEEISKIYKERFQKSLKKELDKINNSLVKDAENIFLLKKKAEIAKFMGDVETMGETYEKLISLNPSNSKTRVAYASARQSIGDLEGALSTLNDALQLDKNNFDALKKQGEMLLVSNRTNEALKSYQDALQIAPDDCTILTQIGITLRELGKYKESIKFFNYALLKSPSYRAAKYEKKKTYSKMFQGGIRINTIS